MPTPFRTLFSQSWPLIGVVHLPALPGSPFHQLNMAELRDQAASDAETLVAAGIDGIVVENFGDHPFLAEAVEPHTVAAMTLLVAEVVRVASRHASGRPPVVGVNVLRNDAASALAIAAMTGARFIRVNVHTGAMVTDQGLIQGQAYRTLNYRRRLEADVAILADVLVKHAHPLGPVELEATAKDTFLRGGAEALILSGRGTGEPADLERVRRVRAVLPQAPLLIGSGLTLETLETAMAIADGAIVGTALKQDGEVHKPVELERARAFVARRARWQERG